jgi:uncharacterized DUF497 family protein
MEFEWDETKNESNREKHGISFDEAKQAFTDNAMLTKEDTRKDYGEKRFIGIGQILEKVIVVVYTIRKTVIRIISARKANEKEKSIYYERKN